MAAAAGRAQARQALVDLEVMTVAMARCMSKENEKPWKKLYAELKKRI